MNQYQKEFMNGYRSTARRLQKDGLGSGQDLIDIICRAGMGYDVPTKTPLSTGKVAAAGVYALREVLKLVVEEPDFLHYPGLKNSYLKTVSGLFNQTDTRKFLDSSKVVRGLTKKLKEALVEKGYYNDPEFRDDIKVTEELWPGILRV
ncbi:MAG: hypothetical protein NTU57_01675 [Candidatus Aenigmarchaeota archaeon]|nr:hypothetical protein [Candidatus Aenigmarchaeota archaeon]